jgi:hypothetical protein
LERLSQKSHLISCDVGELNEEQFLAQYLVGKKFRMELALRVMEEEASVSPPRKAVCVN